MNDQQLYRLDNSAFSLLLAIQQGVPHIVWFGSRLADTITLNSLLASIDLPTPHAKLDETTPLPLFPMGSSGFLGSPALSGHSNGQRFSPSFGVKSVDQDQQSLSVNLRDPLAKLEITIAISLHETSSVMTMQTTLRNTGSKNFQLDWLASGTLPLIDTYTECVSLHGRWGLEFQQQRQPITSSRTIIENVSGRTSHEHAPACICGVQNFDDSHGDLLGAHLAYSGNYRIVVERLSNGSAYLQAGSTWLPGEQTIEAGESITTPELYFCSANGTNQMSQQFHRFARDEILPEWTRAPRPIHANSWEALYFDHSVESMLPLIDAACDLGAERFVLDDGWFEGRRDDTSGLGDWRVDKTIYPDGLHPLVEHVRKRGMQFGLWFEPEMVNPDSNLFREHPQWALNVEGYDTPLARNQLVLNLDLSEVRDYLFSSIETLVEEYKIDYIKWDQNRDLVFPGNQGSASTDRQVSGVYKLLKKLTTRFPSLEIESCASGGARADLGILRYTGRVWTSDTIDPIDRLQIHRGFGLFFPAEIMGSHVGHNVAHLTGRSTSLQTRATLALQGQFGFELDARDLDPIDRDTLAPYIQLYKNSREWLASATGWRIPTREARLFVQGNVSTDKVKSLWTVVAAGSLSATTPERLVLQGLKPDSQYDVNVLEDVHLMAFCKKLPAWVSDGVTLDGLTLMTTGLSLPIMPAQSALLIQCHQAI